MTEPGLHISPAGRGLGLLFFPGVLVSLASGEQLLVAASLAAGAALFASWALARWDMRRLAVDARGPDVTTVDQIARFGLTSTGRTSLTAGSTTLELELTERTILHEIPVPMAAMSSLGLIAAVRPVKARLAEPVHVAPAPIPTVCPPIGASAAAVNGGGDEPSGVRPFAPGDRTRDVHWATTARLGTLHVRDRPALNDTEVGLVVNAAAGPPFERALGQARHLAGQLHAAGYRVVLATADRSEQVRSDAEVARRLAAAQTGRAIEPVGMAVITLDGNGDGELACRAVGST